MTDTRDQSNAGRVDIPDVDDDDITFEDLLGDDAPGPVPATYAQLLADGFPPDGGLAVLSALAQ